MKVSWLTDRLGRWAPRRSVMWGVCLPVILSVIIVAIAVYGNYRSQSAMQARRHAALQNLAKEQAARQKQQKVDTHSDLSTAQFTDVSTAMSNKSACQRLQDRPGVVIADADCNYILRALGAIDVAVVFMHEGAYSDAAYNTLKSGDGTNQNSLAYANTYYKQQAKRYNIATPLNLKFSYFGPYQVTDSVIYKYYYDHGPELLSTYQATAKAHAVPASNYDIVEYVLLDGVYGGVAFPWQHQAFAYSLSEPAVFIHETLHLFGASDKYVGEYDSSCQSSARADPFNRYGGTITGNDIMCQSYSLQNSIINDITAREIGWAN